MASPRREGDVASLEPSGRSWVEFHEYALSRLPPPPARVLEVGCGEEGGIAPILAHAGYDVLAIDPEAPTGPLYRQTTLEELEDPGPFDAVVAGRVLHHVAPLEPGLDKLVRLSRLLVLDEFAHDRIDGDARRWYADERRRLAASGAEPRGPSDLDEWRRAHPGLHGYETLRRALDSRFEPQDIRFGPYFYRWLRVPETQSREERAIEEGMLRPIGFRYTGMAIA